MSRTGHPSDNALAGSFLKTLQYEQIYRDEYRDWAALYASRGTFIEVGDNQQRLHSALGYVPPAAFEQNAEALPCGGFATLSSRGAPPPTPGWVAGGPE